jgi:hypothetical protein
MLEVTLCTFSSRDCEQAPHAIQSRPSLEHGVLTVGTSGKAVFGVSSDSGKALWAFPTGEREIFFFLISRK